MRTLKSPQMASATLYRLMKISLTLTLSCCSNFLISKTTLRIAIVTITSAYAGSQSL